MLIPAPPQPVAHLDVEGYSEAGYVWEPDRNKWGRIPGARQYGLFAVGSRAYAEHPSTEVLCLGYRLPGQPRKLWSPWYGHPPPTDLFEWVLSGGLLQAHNAMFERLIWEFVCVRLWGWPPVRPDQWRCSMATARVNCYPASLESLGDALRLDTRKDKRGKRLIDLLCVPRNPTKADARRRILPTEAPQDFADLCDYCVQDVATEEAASERLEPMSASELAFWLVDQEINYRGMAIDTQLVSACRVILDETLSASDAECRALTGGVGVGQVQALRGWLAGQGVYVDSLGADSIESLLAGDTLPQLARRVLEIRSEAGSASVKKLYSMGRMASRQGRLCNLYNHHGARTGRPTGQDAQPTNLPKAGPDVRVCATTGLVYGASLPVSPWTTRPPTDAEPEHEWAYELRGGTSPVEQAISTLMTGNAAYVRQVFGDPLKVIAGCLRSSFVAAPGHRLISSDFTAIEAVVAGQISGEQWRIDTFRRREDIYLASYSAMFNEPIEVLKQHRKETGHHHPGRQKGKIAELALGYGGAVGSLRNFGAEGTDDELKRLVYRWRGASPKIVEAWGGQSRRDPYTGVWHSELYGIEGAIIRAIQHPGSVHEVVGCKFYVTNDALRILLPGGIRALTYQQPRLGPHKWRDDEYEINYLTDNSNPKMGPLGWVRLATYGPRVFENICQAIAHEVLRHSILALRAAGYPTIMHTYDEIVAEVPDGFGSLEEFERIMSTMAKWAEGWPIYVDGGWVGHRYRKG